MRAKFSEILLDRLRAGGHQNRSRRLVARALLVAAVAAGGIVVTTSAASASPAVCNEDAQYCGFEHHWYGGYRLDFYGRIMDFRDFHLGNQWINWNDRITSVAAGWGGRAYCFYEHINLEGNSQSYGGFSANPNIGSYWNDRFSSATPC